MKTALTILTVMIFFGCQSTQPQYIAVEGKAKVKIPVDYFQVRITIKTEGETLGKANEVNKKLVLKLFDILNKYSISDSDFVTKSSETGESFLPSYLPYGREKRLPSIEYSGELTLRNPNKYDALFKDIIAQGPIEIGVVDFGSFQLEKYKQSAYQLATLDARKQAELLLSGTGHHVGKIFKILQDGRDPYQDYDDIEAIIKSKKENAPEMLAEIALAEPNTFRKKYFNEQVSVTVIYEIK